MLQDNPVSPDLFKFIEDETAGIRKLDLSNVQILNGPPINMTCL